MKDCDVEPLITMCSHWTVNSVGRVQGCYLYGGYLEVVGSIPTRSVPFSRNIKQSYLMFKQTSFKMSKNVFVQIKCFHHFHL